MVYVCICVCMCVCIDVVVGGRQGHVACISLHQILFLCWLIFLGLYSPKMNIATVSFVDIIRLNTVMAFSLCIYTYIKYICI